MKHIPFNPTDEQRSNLMRLAAHLDLGVTNLEFDMSNFHDVASCAYRASNCGTVACAIGHGPSLGIAAIVGENWYEYTERVFSTRDDGTAYKWLFHPNWTYRDNTPRGASARINYALNRGVPENYYEQMQGEAPLSYTVSERPEFTVAQKVTA